LRALGEYEIGGLTTLLPFHEALLKTEQWARGETCRDLTEDREWLRGTAPEAAFAPSGEEEGGEQLTRDYQVEVGGKLFDVRVIGEAAAAGTVAVNPSGADAAMRRPPRRAERGGGGGGAAASEDLVSPLQGTVLKLAVEKGQEVSEGDLICVIEAMKMENEITAHRAGTVSELAISEGASVSSGDRLAKIT